MIERTYARELDLSTSKLKAIVEIETMAGVKWLYSFLSADKRTTYCVYEAESSDVIREAARRAGLPDGIVIELSAVLRPEDIFMSSSKKATTTPIPVETVPAYVR